MKRRLVCVGLTLLLAGMACAITDLAGGFTEPTLPPPPPPAALIVRIVADSPCSGKPFPPAPPDPEAAPEKPADPRTQPAILWYNRYSGYLPRRRRTGS